MPNSEPVALFYDFYEPATGADDRSAPIIFHHGLTASRQHWADIPQRFADETKRKVYVVDARNHGDSAWTDEFSFELVAKDLANFMDNHKMEKAVLVGHSMGGIAAMLVALSKPERVEKLVVEDIGLKKLSKEDLNLIMGFMRTLIKSLDMIPDGADETEARKIIVDFVQEHLSKLMTDNQSILTERKKEVFKENYLNLKRGPDGRFTFKGNFIALEQYMRQLLAQQGEYKAPEGTYRGKALFVYGSLSPMHVGDDAEQLRQHFEDAEFVEIKEAAHSVHEDKPSEFTEAVLRFLTR